MQRNRTEIQLEKVTLNHSSVNVIAIISQLEFYFLFKMLIEIVLRITIYEQRVKNLLNYFLFNNRFLKFFNIQDFQFNFALKCLIRFSKNAFNKQ